MTPTKPKSLHQSKMFRIALDYACRPNYPLVKLAEHIPWEMFKNHFGELYCPDSGRPGLPIRVMVGLLLKHTAACLMKKLLSGGWTVRMRKNFAGRRFFSRSRNWMRAVCLDFACASANREAS